MARSVGTALAPGVLTAGKKAGVRAQGRRDVGVIRGSQPGRAARMSRSSWVMERGMLRPALYIQSISRAVLAQREHKRAQRG